MWAMALRQYRVSHRRVHPAQEARHLARGDGREGGPCPSGLHVVLVVRAGHHPVPAPPRATALGMPLALTRGRAAGPLARAETGMGTEERLAEGTTATAGTPGDSGH